jgi:hypothetical protein
MIEIAMFPSIVRDTAVMIRSEVRCHRRALLGVHTLSTAPTRRGRSTMRNSVRNVRVTAPSTTLNADRPIPMTPPAAFAIPETISLA